MSYLNPLRLHFSGSFQATISTVNNDPLHFNNATFEPSYAEPQTGDDPDQFNGWFNPSGNGDWRLLGCEVTAAFLADGTPVGDGDPIRGAVVADSDSAAPAKLVDLDPEQRLVSMIFGLEVRVATAAGDTLLCGRFEPTAFMDIWDRSQGQGTSGDVDAGAMYQSVLADVEWGDVAASPFLLRLRAAAADGRLSIKFNIDGISLDPQSPRFLMGRIVGTIGPTSAGEPSHFVAGRQLMATPTPAGHFFTPAGGVNFCVAAVDRPTRRVYLDLGNALPTTAPGAGLASVGDLTLHTLTPADPADAGGEAGAAAVEPLGTLPAGLYTDPTWYAATAGIAAFPPDRPLTDDELTRMDGSPLALIAEVADGAVGGAATGVAGRAAHARRTLAVAEPPGGLFVRADQFVFRLNPGEEAVADLYATRLGHPYPDAAVLTIPVPEQLQPDSVLGEAPPVAIPADAVMTDVRVRTDTCGVARLHIRAQDPGLPRGYIDGQVYALYPVLAETIVTPADPYPYNQWNYISLLVWSGFAPDEPPTWHGSIEPILTQYANLYPVMRDFLDLGNYESVCANAKLLILAFSRDANDPSSMPVSRDLSAAKRQTVVRWLTEPGPDGLPLRGEPRQPGTDAAAGRPAERGQGGDSGPTGTPAAPPRLGGKAVAASQRPAARRLTSAAALAALLGGQSAVQSLGAQ